MRLVWIVMACMGLVLTTTVAGAFQETQSGAVAAGGQVPSLQLDTPDVKTADKGKAGTAIQLPGLGNVGIIPNLDFGLELLYGEDGRRATVEEDPAQADDGLRIRGSIKHRF